MRICFSPFLSFLCGFLLFQASQANAQDFRGLKWGMSPVEVLENEKAHFFENVDGAFVFVDSLEGIPVTITHRFFEEQLWQTRIRALKTYIDYDSHIADYTIFKDLMVYLYGEPQRERNIWRSRRLQNRPDLYGIAIKQGSLSFLANWYTAESDIQLGLSGRNFFVDLSIIFEYRRLKSLLRELENE